MGAITLDPSHSLQISNKESQHRSVVTKEIEGLIRVYKDGHVERPQIVPHVTPSLAPELGVTCRDTIIDKYTNVWARVYVPNAAKEKKLPLLLYFHGGGFCVGAASWSCYHEFLSKLTSRVGCAVASVNYRLAPENPLPAAYDDGVKALSWIRQQQEVVSRGPCKTQIQPPTHTTGNEWWANKCDFSSIFLAGDSAGANIAYNVALRANSAAAAEIKGLILIQPFFGGEARTESEAHMPQPPRSALTLAASDAYWRLALPPGASRDHPWCNPRVGATELRRLGVMVCVSETDILRDRNMEWCGRLGREGVRVEQVVCKGVGHAFQILDKSCLAQTRVQELFCHIKSFVGR